MADLVAALGGVDVLVNNAGILRITPLLDITVEEWDLVLDVNARSMLVTTQVAARSMIAAGHGGRIVNMASMGAKRAGADQAHYAASKAAVVALTQAAAIELGPHGITVNAICPGYVLTEMGAATRTPEMVAAVERLVAARPVRRAGRRGPDGPVPGVRRRRLLHRPGVQRHRWDDHALSRSVTRGTAQCRRGTRATRIARRGQAVPSAA